jgi:hypothetical protein
VALSDLSEKGTTFLSLVHVQNETSKMRGVTIFVQPTRPFLEELVYSPGKKSTPRDQTERPGEGRFRGEPASLVALKGSTIVDKEVAAHQILNRRGFVYIITWAHITALHSVRDFVSSGHKGNHHDDSYERHLIHTHVVHEHHLPTLHLGLTYHTELLVIASLF